jgi:hypothetical protein
MQPEGKRPLRRSRLRWEDSITIDRRGRGRCGVQWINSAEEL